MIKRLIVACLSRLCQKKYNMGVYGATTWVKGCVNDYKEKLTSFSEIRFIHKKGFKVKDWKVMGLNKENYSEYMSNVQYLSMHPINGFFSSWIDDKLTLKYLCSATVLDKYLPRYYFQIDAKGNVLALMDSEYTGRVTAFQITELLMKEGQLAIKLVSGSIGTGFYKAEYVDGIFYLNGEKKSREEFIKEVERLRNYLVTEYLRPHEDLAVFSPNVTNCFRYLAARIDGKLEMLKGYIRFGTKESGYVENYNIGGVLCLLDENGAFQEGNVINKSDWTNRKISNHPDTGVLLKGQIPLWKEVVKAIKEFDAYFPQLDYLGFDFVITCNNEIKILEINSLTSLDGIQIDKPVTQTKCNRFFKIEK